MKQKIYPKISFIIPTLNEEVNLPRCLSAIRSQDYPQKLIEIIVADGGSKDASVQIAKSYQAKVIHNPDILHEQGKSRATKIAKGKILFFTDADNVLSHNNWIKQMIQPYLENPSIIGFLPQTIGAPDTNGLDKYLGNLFTDPFTWFVYGHRANPKDYNKVFNIIYKNKGYTIFDFTKGDLPLFGLSQGVGTLNSFKRNIYSYADDLLSGIQLIKERGLVAYVPSAKIYHYHVSGIINFIRKYQWRVKNNFKQQIKGMGIVNRVKYFSFSRKIRMYLFIPYGLSIIFPTVDAIILAIIHKNMVMIWHIPTSFLLSCIILYETIHNFFKSNSPLGTYE